MTYNYSQVIHMCPMCDGPLLIRYADDRIIFDCDRCGTDYQYEDSLLDYETILCEYTEH